MQSTFPTRPVGAVISLALGLLFIGCGGTGGGDISATTTSTTTTGGDDAKASGNCSSCEVEDDRAIEPIDDRSPRLRGHEDIPQNWLHWPVQQGERFYISLNYGESTHILALHWALDFKHINHPIGTRGKQVLAGAEGTVSFVGRYPLDDGRSVYGNTVEIDHGNGWGTRYAHLEENFEVARGDPVTHHSVLGYMGSSGVPGNDNPHLHFEVRPIGTGIGITHRPEPIEGKTGFHKGYEFIHETSGGGIPGVDDAVFEADITIPDGTALSPGEPFTKVWRIKNTGTTTWGTNYRWIFDGGAQMGAPAHIEVPTVALGASYEPSVPMVAPTSPGIHRGYWKMQAPGGTLFGVRAFVEVRVTESVSARLVISESDEVAPGNVGFAWHGPGSVPFKNHATLSPADGRPLGDGVHMLFTYAMQEHEGITNMGDWRPLITEAGNYEVYVYVPRWFGDTRSARYEIYAANGRHDRAVDQRVRNDEWVPLGVFPFNAGDSGFLRLIDVTSDPRIDPPISGRTRRWIAFDSAKWERR